MHQIRDPPPRGPDTKPSLFRRLQNVRRQTTRLVHIPVAARVSAVQRKYIKNKSKTIIINKVSLSASPLSAGFHLRTGTKVEGGTFSFRLCQIKNFKLKYILKSGGKHGHTPWRWMEHFWEIRRLNSSGILLYSCQKCPSALSLTLGNLIIKVCLRASALASWSFISTWPENSNRKKIEEKWFFKQQLCA